MMMPHPCTSGSRLLKPFFKGDTRKQAFATGQRGLCTDFPTFFIKVESWFFVCGIELRFHNILIHYCSGVRSDLSARFKRPQKKKLLLRVSLKLLQNWRNGSQITPPAFLSIAPFKTDVQNVECKLLRMSLLYPHPFSTHSNQKLSFIHSPASP